MQVEEGKDVVDNNHVENKDGKKSKKRKPKFYRTRAHRNPLSNADFE